MISFNPRSLYLSKRSLRFSLDGGLVGLGAGLDVVTKKKFLRLTGIEPWPSSQSLY
jgi:hypothetical protein